MATTSLRLQYYQECMEADQASLLHDIDLWLKQLPEKENTPIRHHVEQFQRVCTLAVPRLMQEYNGAMSVQPQGQVRVNSNQSVFQALVIGALNAQWILLRQVAAQRLPTSPYQQGLAELDDLAIGYYYRLRAALPEEARKRVTVSSPLVYLGSIAEVTLFSRDAPSVLSVPFGALDDEHPFSREISRDTIPHEVAHAVFNQLSDFIPELELKYLSSARTDDQQLQVLHGVIREWLNEMVADMAGTALAGPDFAKSAIRIMALPDEAVGIADARHPAPFIRPYIHVATLEHLGVEEAKVRPLKDELDQVCGDRMKARFESCPDLTVVTLETVKDEMINAIKVINDISLDALGGKLGDILKNCTQGSPSAQLAPNQKERLPSWSDSVGKGDKFVLRLIGSLRPEHATPVSFPYCWFFRLLGLPCPS